MKKRILSLLLVLAVCFAYLPAYAADLSIVTEETLMKGVTYRNMKKLFENGWQDIHIVTADLNEKHLKFDVLSSQSGKSHLENTYDSAKAADAIAAVNADFFLKTSESKRGSGIGLEISDGIIRTSPAAYEQMNALYQVEKTGEFLFDMFSYEFTVTAPDEESAPISVINKYDSMTGIVLYTPDWGEMTPGSAGNVLEVVVEDGVVTAKNRDVGPVAIPEDGFVLACDLSMHTFLDDHLQVDDEIELSITTTPDYETIKTAVGGGGMLLVEGQVQTEYSHTVSGTHPRTAVGIDKTGKIITLVVVDGRRTGATGMTMPQLGQLMKDLGCYNAMNLDGGGSSLMALKQEGAHQVVNTPSDGGKRPVTNSIGILTDTKKPVATQLV
ncbi:MAG: phosphodiester glycosidase family protein, partial [Clostridia bacterium]|nr:phosphodiester glycosidase family protein [Clostridia bacterium]